MEFRRKLPIGMQTFSQLIEGSYIYVDKTRCIGKVINSGKAVFLSRPRRFGKSLFVSTLDAYFNGKKELFDGLALADLEPQMAKEEGRDAWIKYPVINITFDGCSLTSYNDFINSFNTYFDYICQSYQFDSKALHEPESKFKSLIPFLYAKYNLPVVILIDEYDKVLLSAIDDPELLDRYIKFFKGFYGNLKGCDQYIKFAFITGVTKFSKVSIFSDLNNLKDISMLDDYADICGITKDELKSEFQPEITAMAEKHQLTYTDCLAKLKQCYDGYRFTPKLLDIYNPFCLLNALADKLFGNYWFQSGTPTFLVKAIHNVSFDLKSFDDGIEVSVKSIEGYKLDYQNIVPMMYQSGYLTIKEYDDEYETCVLGYPNDEVRYAFKEQLVLEYSYLTHNNTKLDYVTFSKYVRKGEVDKFMTAIKAMFAAIPYPTSQKKYELDYQTIFYLIFTLLGQTMQTEVHTNTGRIDAVCETKDFIYLFEFKLNGTVEEALKQIDDKDYAVSYEASGKNIKKIGVAIDLEKRNIKDYKII
ncbi:MAG: ATP-binding protein [Spirochaetales bacterium]|nr:ATP-binding protein [Spirochaetales bacterium]